MRQITSLLSTRKELFQGQSGPGAGSQPCCPSTCVPCSLQLFPGAAKPGLISLSISGGQSTVLFSSQRLPEDMCGHTAASHCPKVKGGRACQATSQNPAQTGHKGRKHLANILLNKQKDEGLEGRLGEWRLSEVEGASPSTHPVTTLSEALNKTPGSGGCPPACLPLCVSGMESESHIGFRPALAVAVV